MIQTVGTRAPGSKLAQEVGSRLNHYYGQVAQAVSVMTQVKVTKKGPSGVSLTTASAKSMLQTVFNQIKELNEATTIGKGVPLKGLIQVLRWPYTGEYA